MSVDEDRLRAWLVQRIARAGGLRPELIDAGTPVQELGVSSRDAVVIAAEFGELIGKPLEVGLLWRYPTVGALVEAFGGTARSAPPVTGSWPAAGPIAVIGIGCRLPGGADSPAALWRLLDERVDAVGTVPAGRWAQFAPEESWAELPRHGGFLDDVAGFDAAFFGISAREATTMDPQQRILLETAWAALEHAGIAPGGLKGTRTGVFAGISSTEYSLLTMADPAEVDAWSGSGAAAAVVANRLSYHLDLRGPSMVIDTACSSSLVAVHHAARALAAGDADLALAAGVNLLLSPSITANFHRAGVLAPDGRCKAFSAAADGIVRGEGCGVVVLKRLTDARRDGDRVLAVIRGSAVNSDGRSNGLTAPNPVAQEQVIAEAHAGAGSDPSTVDYVETHGTGTPLGDPVEARALAAVLSRGRDRRRPLLLGSAKTNFGHLEGAAGVLGLIKTVLALWHGRIPATLHFAEPSPHIDFSADALSVVDTSVPWPRYSGTARAGVSAFGFGGTNAHVVLEEWARPLGAAAARGSRWGGPAQVFALSARSEIVLRRRAGELAAWLHGEDGRVTAPGELAGALSSRREHLPLRAAVVASTRAELVAGLRSVADGTTTPDQARADSGPVFVFSGYGSQWPAMGRRLLSAESEFRAGIERLEPLFLARADFSVRQCLRSTKELTDPAIVQPVLFGMQVALAGLWQAHGVEPSAVLGHSMGEIAAAVTAGALDVEEGLWIVTTRSRLLSEMSASGAGAMAVVELSAAELHELEERFPSVAVAVYASPTQCTVSGSADQVAALVAYVEGLGRLARRLNVTGAGHSPAVDAVLAEFRTGLGALRPRPLETPCYSSVLDDPRGVPAFDEDYWADNLRRPVRFTHALAAAMADGHRTFLEISPHPIALTAVEQTALAAGVEVRALPSWSKRSEESFLNSLAALHTHGHPDVLRRRHPDAPVLDLPAPPWDHRPYWVRRRPAGAGHPLLGTHVEVPGERRHLWQAKIGPDTPSWLPGHRVHGITVFPATGYLELVLACARRRFTGGLCVEALDVHRMLPVTGDTELTTEFRPEDETSGSVQVFAREPNGSWAVYASARVCADPSPRGPEPLAEVTGESLDLYAELSGIGQHYGVAFRGLHTVRAARGRASAGISLPEEAGSPRAYAFHPALADACLHALAAAGAADLAGEEGVYLPTRLGRVRLLGDPGDGVRCHATLSPHGTDYTGAVQLVDAAGEVVVDISDVRVRRLGGAGLAVPLAARSFETRWAETPLPAPEPGAHSFLVLTDEHPASLGRALGLALGLAELGDQALSLPADDLAELPGMLAAGAGVALLIGSPQAYRDPEEAQRLLLAVTDVVRRMAEAPGSRLYLLTQAGTAIRDGEPGEPGLGFLRGLIRVLAFEHPGLHATLVDVDAQSGADSVVSELRAAAADDEVAWRQGVRYAARLTRTGPFATDGVTGGPGAYVITGGLGRLGLVTARWLADSGATRIVLSGRQDRARDEVGELRLSGVDIVVVTGDLAEPGVAERIVAATEGLPLRGVVHAAGVLADRLAGDVEAEDLAAVWRPKVLGAQRLHEATAHLTPAWWLVYSSAAALLGSPGQTSYATANAWLDAFVAWRRFRGLPAATINWGAWAGTGGDRAENPVLEPMPVDEGIEALEAVLASGRAATGITRLDVPRTVALFPELTKRPFFEAVLEDATVEPGWAGAGAGTLKSLGAKAGEAIADRLATVLSGLLGCRPAEVAREVPLTQLGLDSLMAMRARAAAERDFGTALPIPLLLRGASIAEVAAHLTAELGLEAAPASAPKRSTVDPRDHAERWLHGLWRQTLGTEEFGVHQDFPGDATAARRFYELASGKLPGVAPFEELFAVPTIAAMADLVRERLDGPEGTPMRVLRERGEGPPLFLFHPAGGPTSVYQPLIEHLGVRLPCYGFERLDEVPTLEEKAAQYVELLRAVQPEGPYRLGGWSFGGLLAFEAAHQLTELGERVEVLALIDSILPLRASGEDDRELVVERLIRFVAHVEATYDVELGVTGGALRKLGEVEQLQLVMGNLSAAVPGMGRSVLRHQYTSYVDARVGERYEPRPYDGRVVLYRAKDPHPLTTSLDPRYRRTDDALGWDAFCPDLHVVPTPGDHLSMIDPPHVAVLARHFATVLSGRTTPGVPTA
ncbi:polyketide synthase [Amycolatopsis sp. H20-H5]|uniref:polyketide synthase n=1 Tax=Amycolatopsis sp. H20-H5 TaxID=3046309 RepID=UPI002DC021A8|nr:polyketide synthase [Amycolatopsis sp. H20-H5]MEC3978422.1 beta-ketoacyl synthase N-terminal-like domain-containing protein [Amycolatopsis sp. H20-H5]